MMKVMKGTITLLMIFFTATVLFGQTKHKTKPFIIKGQINNCPEKYLQIFFRDANDQVITDTIHLDEDGNFYLKTFKVQQPQQASIQQNNIQINKLFVAPGYDLTLTGNGEDYLTLFKSKKISGVGSQSNQYQFLLDSIAIARADTIRWYELNERDLLSYIKSSQRHKDSVAQIVFGNPAKKDQFLKYFASMVRLDNKFNQLYILAAHANWSDYDYNKAVSFVRSNFDNKLLDNLYKDEYLISSYYRTWILTGEWLNYLIGLDYKKDSLLQSQKDYKFKKISNTYTGKARELALYDRLKRTIELCKTLESLNDCINYYEVYGTTLNNAHYRENLATTLEEKKLDLLRTQVGNPAPSFVLQSSQGIKYSLESFKGKVVYLDLWASWCGPCREETPILKTLYDQYKHDDRIAFVSIAVHDEEGKWRKAISEDKPDWLQLLDKEGFVAKSYFANLIPQFVLIDKKGNIVNFNAPRPSSGQELQNLLRLEIAK